MKEAVWLREMARDIVALGGLPFFILVLVRVWMLDNVEYILQFVVAGIVFGMLFFVFRQNVYSGLGLIVLVFTSLYYGALNFAIFAMIVYILLLISLFYLKKDVGKILAGVILGILGIGCSYLF